MRILFVNISRQWNGRTYQEYPYGIGILATLAKQAGHLVSIFDMAVDPRDLKDVLANIAPEVIAISFLSPSVRLAKTIIKHMKEMTSAVIISGGVHSTLFPESVLRYGADIVIIGEGEITLMEVLCYLENGTDSIREKCLSHICGIAYLNVQKEMIRTPLQETSTDIEALPIMDRDIFDLSLYAHHTILTSRCCPYHCRFCCSWAPGGRRGRVMSGERIMKELKWMIDRYGALELYWGDEIFFWSKEDRIHFCKLLKKNRIPIKFTMQMRADLIDDDLIEALLGAGCTMLCIGAESGSDILLRTAGKNITAIQLEKAINRCVSHGLRCKTWWIVGLPGSGVKEQLKSLEVIEKSRPNEVAVHQFVPLPGSEFWDKAEEYGIILPDEASFENLNYYADPRSISYRYITGNELYFILKTYEKKLRCLGYVPTDCATTSSPYVFTTPFQEKTFNI